jgi:SNF2 family DNA or RNA helicase
MLKAKVQDPHGVVSFWEEGNCWLIKTKPHIALRFKRVFPKINPGEQGILRLADTPENCRDLEWFLERYPHDCPYATMLRNRAKLHREAEAVITQLMKAPPPNGRVKEFKMAKPPRDYQVQLADLLKATGGILCADDAGLGKSISAITSFVDPRLQPALIVCLAHLPQQWRDFVREFAPHLRIHILSKGVPYNFKDKWGDLPDVIISSYHKIRDWAETLAAIVKSVTFDECAELRHEGTQKYNAARVLCDATPYRLGLSATPIYNYGIEMFNVMRCLKPDALGSRDEFVTEWCAGDKIRDPRAFGEYLRSSGLMVRRTRADVKRELPKCQTIVHTIECDEQALEAGIAGCDDLANIIVSRSEVYRGQKMQAAAEFDMRMRQATGIAKAGYVAEFVRMLVEGGQKVLLYGWHRAVYAIWLKRLEDLGPVMYTGSESPAQKNFSKERFINGDSQVMLMSLRAGAGTDGIQKACCTVVKGELDWSPGIHLQCIWRVDRDGQENPVFAYYLVCDYGSDPIVSDTLGLKRQQSEGILNPAANIIEGLQIDPEHVKRLAEAYLRRKHA